MVPPPSLPHSPSCPQSMKTLLLLPALSLLLLPPCQGFRPIQLNTTKKPVKVLTDENILDVVKQGLTNQEAKQILMQLFRTSLHDRYMKELGKGFALKLKMADLVRLFSEKTTADKRNYPKLSKHAKRPKHSTFPNSKFISFINRIQ